MWTTIKVTRETVEALKKLKIVRRETYDEVITRLREIEKKKG